MKFLEPNSVAIACMILRKPYFIVLDEASITADTSTEAQI
jgi:ABC-type transport system involved in Fe-S cluster assembly fused permease/ATPase subunit